MRIKRGTLVTSLALLVGFSSESLVSDESVGEVVIADPRSWIEREGVDTIEPIPLDQAETHDVQANDTLTSTLGGYVLMDLDLSGRGLSEVVVTEGIVTFKKDAEGLICEVSGTVLFTQSRGDAPALCGVHAGGHNFRHTSTEFLIDARGIETSLFVIEGSVEVFSEDPAIPEGQVVLAGEWLVTRKGEPIPEPKRYRRTDVISGSSECIYSWCRLTRSIDIEPLGPMRVLIPPPPNPPGRQ